MMLNCREASRLASESMDRPLPLRTRISLGLHLMMCRFCRRYLGQIRFIRKALRLADDETRWEAESSTVSMPVEAKERIRERLRDH